MKIINEKVIREIGYQIEPSQECMNREERTIFKSIIADITSKELKATEIKALEKEIVAVTNVLSSMEPGGEKSDLMQHYYKLSRRLKDV